MLISFRVRNFRSLRTPQELSLVASRFEQDDPRLIRVRSISPLKLLRGAAIYGANASGKSNVLLAMNFMRTAVLRSHTDLRPDQPFPLPRFAFEGSASAWSYFEIVFLHDDVRTEYGFVLGNKSVKGEWLVNYPQRRRVLLFRRIGPRSDQIRFGSRLRGENRATANLTRRNSLFLSTAANNNHDFLTAIWQWFNCNLLLVDNESERDRVDHAASRVRSDLEFRTFLLSLLRDADVGVDDCVVEQVEPDKVFEQLRDTFTSEALDKIKTREFLDIRLRRGFETQDSRPSLGLSEESEGTRSLIALAPIVYDALKHNRTIMLDEVLSNTHELVTADIVRRFLERTEEPGGQVIVATHDSNLMREHGLLRRDQIWLTEKNGRGATRLFPLSDFRVRRDANMAQAYHSGRFGAVPFLAE